MEHSAKFEMVETFYMRGAWDTNKVHNAVVKGWITPAEYTEITGCVYEA